MPYTASCHCGQTAFEFEGDIQQALAAAQCLIAGSP